MNYRILENSDYSNLGLEAPNEQVVGALPKKSDFAYIVVRFWPPLKGKRTHRLALGPFETQAQATAARQKAERSELYSSNSEFYTMRMRLAHTVK